MKTWHQDLEDSDREYGAKTVFVQKLVTVRKGGSAGRAFRRARERRWRCRVRLTNPDAPPASS